MGTHPNAMLLAVLTPDGLARATMRSILDHCGVKEDDDIVIPIGAEGKVEPEMPPVPMRLYHSIMEQSYDDGWQISAKEGDLVFFELVTYGYGEYISWADLEAKKVALDEWCKNVCSRFHCSYEIRVSANYWWFSGTSELGASLRGFLDSMEPDELAEVRAEVDRTARVVSALAGMRRLMLDAKQESPSGLEWQAVWDEQTNLFALRARQRKLEAARAQKGGAK